MRGAFDPYIISFLWIRGSPCGGGRGSFCGKALPCGRVDVGLLHARIPLGHPVRGAFVSLVHEFLRVVVGRNMYMCGVRQGMLVGALGQAGFKVEGGVPIASV